MRSEGDMREKGKGVRVIGEGRGGEGSENDESEVRVREEGGG